MKLLQTFQIVIIVATCAFAQVATRNANVPAPNYRIYPRTITQTEVFVANHPSNQSILFSSANTINLATGFISEGVYVSHDAGVTWTGSDTCKGSPILFHRGDPGIAIDKDGRFIMARLGFQDGLFAHFSSDSGRTWSSQRTIALERQDRATVVSDINTVSPSYGRTYTTYVEFLPPFPVKVSYTNDGGASWSAPQAVNNPSQRSQGAELVLGIDSTLFLMWAGVQSSSPYTEDFIGIAKTTNGGGSWNVTENAIDINGIQGTMSQKSSIRVNGLPKGDVDRTSGIRRGWYYIVTTQKNLLPAGTDPDIVLYRSSDGGTTWSSGIRVNQDPLNNGKIQYFPAVHIDDGGGVNVIYYDDRTTSSDSAGIMLSRSTDGGTTWKDFQISDHHFKPQSIGGLGAGYQGDNISLTGVGGTLLPFWMDNSSGLYQIWSARIPISSLVSVAQSNRSPGVFVCGQNYPNPFNPSTIISYSLPIRVQVEVTVFDLLGREVAILAHEVQSAGEHQLQFVPSREISSGIYFFTVKAGEWSSTGKMIYQK